VTGRPPSIAFRGRAISVELRETPAGRREVVLHPGAVAILAPRDGRILLVRQMRDGAGCPLWEIPAGVLEPGERPLAAAKRELMEETGLTAETWRYLGLLYPTPGHSNERIFLFLAVGVRGTPTAGSEVDAVGFFTRGEIVRFARRGQGDGKTLAALALADATLSAVLVYRRDAEDAEKIGFGIDPQAQGD
jgi:ADP-ribose pyrophosphatase